MFPQCWLHNILFVSVTQWQPASHLSLLYITFIFTETSKLHLNITPHILIPPLLREGGSFSFSVRWFPQSWPHSGQCLISVLELRYFRIFCLLDFYFPLALARSVRGEVLSIVVFSRESQSPTFLEQSINKEYQRFTTAGFYSDIKHVITLCQTQVNSDSE